MSKLHKLSITIS